MTKENKSQTNNQKKSQADELLDQLGQKFQCNEVGNMERFIEQHKAHVRYLPSRKNWLIWDESRWCICDRSQIFSLALRSAKDIYDEARDCDNEEGKKKLTSWALKSQNKNRINSMMEMASNHPDIVESFDKFDTNSHHINCLNGIVDLKLGELITRSSDDLVLKQAPVNYFRHKKCKTFDKFLHDIFNGDKELISWMQRAIGYTITGNTSEQCFFLAYGTGANGKSTLFETILDILGDYGRSAEFETFLSKDRSSTRVLEGVGKLQGIRFALASEADSSRRFSEALIKKITGEDTVTGTQLYGSSFEFRPEFKLWLLANHLPIAKDASHGFWRRVKVVPFARRFTTDQIDQNLREKLMQEKEGIVAWCVRGAMNWYKENQATGGRSGIGSCAAIEEATAIYRSDNDLFSKFLEACVEQKSGGTIPAQEFYDAYKAWCEKVDEGYPCSQAIFSSRLEERSIIKKRTSSGNVYQDVCLKVYDDDDDDFSDRFSNNFPVIGTNDSNDHDKEEDDDDDDSDLDF